jgi:hypothetical protein
VGLKWENILAEIVRRNIQMNIQRVAIVSALSVGISSIHQKFRKQEKNIKLKKNARERNENNEQTLSETS